MVKITVAAILVGLLSLSLGETSASSDFEAQARHRKHHHKAHGRNDRMTGIWKAGKDAQDRCQWLGQNFVAQTSLKANGTFVEYWDQGSNPSLETLVASYPNGTLPKKFIPDFLKTLLDVGPDVDISADHGYGKSDGPKGSRLGEHGPLGSLPAFCRLGGFISTSDLTGVFFEAWMPLATDPDVPLAQIDTADYPTNSTPVVLGPQGQFLKGPPYLFDTTTNAAAPAARSLDGNTEAEEDNHLVDRESGARKLNGNKILDLVKYDGWNGRLLWIGNGAQRGFPPLPDLKSAMSRYRFAVAGSNAGHWSASSATSWALGSQKADSAADWAHRASHVGRQAALEAIDLFYGPDRGVRVPSKPSATTFSKSRLRTYYSGCSVGGAQGFGSVQNYPHDFDGVLAGSPALYFNSLNHGQIHTQTTHRAKIIGDAIFNVTQLLGPVHSLLLDQCDGLDGVKDGVITYAEQCKFDFSPLLCGANSTYGQDAANCFKPEQLANLQELYKPTVYEGTEIYPRYLPGIETSATYFTGAAGKAIGWIEDAILNNATDKDWDGYNQTLAIWKQGEDLNLGGSNFDKADISATLNADVKIIHYHGLADMTISPLASTKYFHAVHDAVQGKLKDGKKVKDNYRYFTVPGMSHCRGGPGAWVFGCSTQNDAGNVPARFDNLHDAILALVAWTELGASYAPDFLVGIAYNAQQADVPNNPGLPPSTAANDTQALPTTFNSVESGVKFTRKLCPYPLLPTYSGSGPTDGKKAWKSFDCKKP
ncbi:hypothetical protein OC842_006261 [Tilletia horrida]|uniref:Carboxylic ester hydrolase n=1 Tax=Tilletia horrida TaxID=155126 RepID=A0AAN6G674_9BASI|nr:hypothetical protein OC842_006261 [Tilletia horrida]